MDFHKDKNDAIQKTFDKIVKVIVPDHRDMFLTIKNSSAFLNGRVAAIIDLTSKVITYRHSAIHSDFNIMEEGIDYKNFTYFEHGIIHLLSHFTAYLEYGDQIIGHGHKFIEHMKKNLGKYFGFVSKKALETLMLSDIYQND